MLQTHVVHILSPSLSPFTHSTLRKDIAKSKFLLLLLICVLVPFTFVCTIRCLVTTHPHYNFTIYGSVTFQTPLLLSVWFLLSLLNTTSCVYTCSLLSIQKSTQCTVHQNPGKLKYCWKQMTFTSIKVIHRILYVVTCSYFVHWVWVHELPWYIQVFQTAPGLSILLEGIAQDVFALFFSTCPSSLKLALEHKREFALQIKFLALLNFFLFIHTMILLIMVVVTKTAISTVLVQVLTLLEVLYRIHSIYIFYNVIRHVHEVSQHTLIAGQDHSVLCLKKCSPRKPPGDNKLICQLTDAETTYNYLPVHAKRPVLRCKSFRKDKIE